MKKNKFLSCMLVMLIFASMFATTISAEAATSGDYYYTVNADGTTCTIDEYKGAGGEVIIPDSLDGYTVSSIGDHAFQGCSGLTSVTIPSSVESIGDQAFVGCSGLVNVTIKDGVESIGDFAFYGCNGLTGITIPDSVASIGRGTFYNCSGLTGVTIQFGVLSIGNEAFAGCSGLTGVTIPGSIGSIGESAFANCSGLTGVTIQFGVESIGDYAFIDCSGLTDVTIPGSVESIGEQAFDRCSGLTGVTIQFGVESIGYRAFSRCSELTGVTIPGSVGSIGESAFANCSGLTGVTIQFGVESIGTEAFYCCSNLKDVKIPGSVKSIGSQAFIGCSGLTSVTIKDGVESIGEMAFYGCSGLTGVTIPGSVGSIGECAFIGCILLTDVTIQFGVERIGNMAFYHCSGLTGVTIPASVMSIGQHAFNGCSGLTSVTIPDSVERMEWQVFSNCSNLSRVYFDGSKPTIDEPMCYDVSPSPIRYYPAGKTGYDTSFQAVTDIKTVAVSSTANGTITPSTAFGMPGETISLKIIPDDGYKLKSGSLTYNDGSSSYSIGSVGFTMPDDHITISGEFEKITFPAVSVIPNASMTKTRKPVWNWTDATGDGYYRYKLNDAADWTYTELINYTPANDLSDGDYTLYVQEQDSKGYWSDSGSASITVKNTPPAASLNSPSGTGAAVTTSNIVLGFSENVTAVENKKVTISDGINSYKYIIGSGDNYITVTDSVCSAAIPISSFLNGTTKLSLGYGTTYTVAVEAGAYVDGAGNEIPASANIGGFTTAVKNTTSNNKDSNNTAPVAVENSESATVTVTLEQVSDVINKAAEAAAGSHRYIFTISTPIASISFDAKALDTIAKEASEDVKITASMVDASTLSEETKQIVGDRPVFDFSVTSGNKVISQFGGNVSVSVPYTPKPGEDISAIVIYYINTDGKPEAVADCSYDPETGMITFATNHFSRFAVGYHKVAFRDVAPTAWYSDAVSFVAAREITTGTGDGNYSPKAKLTRGQFLVMVMRAYGIPADTDSNDNFSDAGNTYYTGYLSAAKRLGLSSGIGDNMFAPEKKITRQEMFTLLYNTLKQIDEIPAVTTGKNLNEYSDANDMATWAKDAMTLFVKTGTLTGSNGKLTPADTADRAQMAQILYKLLSE